MRGEGNGTGREGTWDSLNADNPKMGNDGRLADLCFCLFLHVKMCIFDTLRALYGNIYTSYAQSDPKVVPK